MTRMCGRSWGWWVSERVSEYWKFYTLVANCNDCAAMWASVEVLSSLGMIGSTVQLCCVPNEPQPPPAQPKTHPLQLCICKLPSISWGWWLRLGMVYISRNECQPHLSSSGDLLVPMSVSPSKLQWWSFLVLVGGWHQLHSMTLSLIKPDHSSIAMTWTDRLGMDLWNKWSPTVFWLHTTQQSTFPISRTQYRDPG